MAKARKTSEEAMAEMEHKERDAINNLGLDDEDVGMDGMPSDDEINAMFDQPEPGEEPEEGPDRDPSVELSDPFDDAELEKIKAQEEFGAPRETIDLQAECMYCHNPIFITADPGVSKEEAEKIAGKFCKCAGAKLAKQGSTLGKKIDFLFGPDAMKYGFVDTHTNEELELLKGVGLLVAERKVKGVVVTLENGDKATILVKKDNTVVRRNKATKAEMEA